jgi:rhodanese-related sulfurtransferase
MPSSPSGKKILFGSFYIIILGMVFGIFYNTLISQKIPLFGSWNNKVVADSITVPYSYDQPSDPPAITLDQAQKIFQKEGILFVDSRLEEDFDSGHIPNSLNLPYEEFENHFPLVKNKLLSYQQLVIYCDGSECETSLLLARTLQDEGYGNIKVFFGGIVEWKEAGLPIEGS